MLFSLPQSKRAAFTLIELLTVIAIIGILASIIKPTVGKVRASAKKSQCLGNLRQIGLTVNLYSSENCGILVPVKDDTANLHFTDLLAVYAQREIKNISDNALKGVNPIFKCPTYENDPARNATRFYVWGYGMSTQILLPERQNHNWTSDVGGKLLL